MPYDIVELPKMSTDCLNDPSADNDMFLNDWKVNPLSL